jgi:hypothetical protein
MFEKLRNKTFDVQLLSHAQAILSVDFRNAIEELEEALLSFSVPIEELVASGGGEAKGTQRLRKDLVARDWAKHIFTIDKTIDGRRAESISHEVDHVKRFEAGTIALEIEWNNKDPFFDRDLENFKRLHAEGAISVGVIITRGTTIQNQIRPLLLRFAEDRQVTCFDDLQKFGVNPTQRQQRDIKKRAENLQLKMPPAQAFQEAWSALFVADKFGAATTHWAKLQARVNRGVGNPCPLLLIGIPDTVLTFGEPEAVITELIEESGDDV